MAEDVEQAIEKSDAGEIELLLMKLDLPTEQGWEAIDEITEENPFLPIVVVTRRPALRYLAEATGACALVEEPVDVPALLQMIRELLVEPVQRRMERVLMAPPISGGRRPAAESFAQRATVRQGSLPLHHGAGALGTKRMNRGERAQTRNRDMTPNRVSLNPLQYLTGPCSEGDKLPAFEKLIPKVTGSAPRE